jgi:hypothetical protein
MSKVSLERGTRITDDVTGIKAEILGPKDNGYYPVLLWDDKHVPTIGRLRSLPKSHEKQEQTEYAENMRSALKDTWKNVVKFKKSSPKSKKVRLKSEREITVTTKNSAKGRSRRRKRGGVSVRPIGRVPLGQPCDVNEDCQLGLQCVGDPYISITGNNNIKKCRRLNDSRKRRKPRRKSRRRKRRKSRRKSRRRKRRTRRRR